jgi:hypothetical protein
MTGLVIFVGLLLVVWAVALVRQPRRAPEGTGGVPDTDAEAWRALLRPVRFVAPVAYGTLSTAIRDCVGADLELPARAPRLAQRALDSQTTSFVFGTGERRLFVATVVCEPEGTGSRGRLEVSASLEGASDPHQRRALQHLRARVAEGVGLVGGSLRDVA